MAWVEGNVTKRSMDCCLVIPGIVILSPLLVVLAVLVRMTFGAPVLFQQIRPGQGGRPFMIYKFRTMLDRRDGHGKLLSDEARLTRFGRFLRSTSLDELPELFNVIKGDMSLVGPRPLLMEYLDLYTPRQARRNEVKPGITGWAQINGRNDLSWEEKFDLDLWYVDNWSLTLDMKILWLTLVKVIKREGISAKGHVTAPCFRGSNSGQNNTPKSG